MKCTACGWSNPDNYQRCFSCNQPLAIASAPAPAPAPTTAPQAPRKEKQRSRTGAPDASAIDVRPSTTRRILAAGIDAMLMLVFVIAGVAALVTAFSGGGLDLGWFAAAIGIVLLGALVPAMLDSFTTGSIGKRLTKIRVVNNEGVRANIVQNMIRTLIKYGAHFALPLIYFLIEGLFFKNRKLHELATSTYVVDSRADAGQIFREIEADSRGRALGLMVKIVLVLIGVGLLMFAGLVAYLIAQPKNPKAEALKPFTQDLKKITGPVENYFYAKQSFPPDLAALGGTTLPPGFRALAINETSGVITLTLSAEAGAALDGKRLFLYPEYKKKKKAGEIKKWKCASSDIAQAELPYTCQAKVPSLLTGD